MIEYDSIIETYLRTGRSVYEAELILAGEAERSEDERKQLRKAEVSSHFEEFRDSVFYRALKYGLDKLETSEYSLVYSKTYPNEHSKPPTNDIALHKRPFSWAGAMAESVPRLTISASWDGDISLTKRDGEKLYESKLPDGWLQPNGRSTEVPTAATSVEQVVQTILEIVTFEIAQQGLLPTEEDMYAKDFRERGARGEIRTVRAPNPE